MEEFICYLEAVGILLGGIASLLMSLSYIKADSVDEFEYVILILLAILGMITIVTCNDLLVIYLGIELQSLCLYVLATLKRHSRFSTEAGPEFYQYSAHLIYHGSPFHLSHALLKRRYWGMF